MSEIEAADLVFLEMCDEFPCAELEIFTWIQGERVPEGEAWKVHAEEMVRRGYFERVASGGSKSRLQGARMRSVYRRTEAANVALAALRRVRELEAELEALRPKREPPRRASRAKAPAPGAPGRGRSPHPA